MSCTTVYGAFADGDMVELGECQNAWLGAVWIWQKLAERYLWNSFSSDDPLGYKSALSHMAEVCSLADDARLSDAEHYALVSTFDGAMVPPELMAMIADALDNFEPGTENLAKQAQLIREAANKGARAIGWLQTSVCSSPWYVHQEDTGDYRAWNLDRDKFLPEIKRDAWWMQRRAQDA
jgi:hypothetical protein